MIADRALNNSAKEIGRLVKGAKTFANCSGENTVLPTTSKRSTLIVRSPPGIFSGVVGVGELGSNNSSGGGKG